MSKIGSLVTVAGNVTSGAKDFLGKLFEQAVVNPRLRQNFDLRTSANDNSQRMLNALLPGTVVPIHRHPQSTENVFLLCGKIVEVICDENGNENALCVECIIDPETLEKSNRAQLQQQLKSDVFKALAELPTYKQINNVIIRETPFVKTTTNKIKRAKDGSPM